MKPAKRQIILGALILALGAAVYLNWQFTDTIANGVIETSTLSDSSEIEDSDLGVAQLVNSNYIETVTDEIPSEEVISEEEISEEEISETAKNIENSDALAQARIERQTSRDEALEILDDILDDDDADTDTKKTAIEQSSLIAQNMIKETTAENLIKAKGVEDAVVFISEDNCTVVAKNAEENLLIIQEIIINQTGFALEQIQILEA
ncbi:MAG: SpoIIIAH-like family protein [Clostridia bacterium]